MLITILCMSLAVDSLPSFEGEELRVLEEKNEEIHSPLSRLGLSGVDKILYRSLADLS